MKIKKSLAFLLSFALALSCFPITSFAGVGLVPGRDKAKMEFVYLKEDASGEINNAYKEITPENIADENLAAGSTFYVGIRNKDFANIQEVADGDKGISDISFALSYDPTYLSLSDEDTETLSYEDDEAYQDLLEERMGTGTDSILQTFGSSRGKYNLNFMGHKESDVANGGWNTLLLPYLNNHAANATYTSEYNGASPVYFAIVGFKVKAVPPSGATVFKLSENPSDTSLKFVTQGVEAGLYQYEGIGMSTSNILTVLDFDLSGIDIFPKGADVLDNIEAKTKADGAYTLPTQYVGQAFDPDKGRSGNDVIKVTAHYTNTNTKDVTNKVTYKLGTTDALAATPNSLTDLPDTFTSADLTGDKYVYAVYTEGSITKAYCLGQLKVEENTITTIAVKKDGPTASTFGASGTSHHHYTTQNVLDVLDDDDDRLTVTLTYKDGSSKDVTYSGTVFDDNGIALYYKDADNKLQKVVKEPTPTKFATGENVYYVALAAGVEGQLASAVSIKTGDDDIKVTGLEDSIVLDTPSLHTIWRPTRVIHLRVISATSATTTLYSGAMHP